MTLDEIKLYLRVDGTEDDVLITSLQQAAIRYMQNTTGKAYDSTNELHNLLVKLLVANWYENRIANVGNNTEVPHSITALMIHLGLITESDIS